VKFLSDKGHVCLGIVLAGAAVAFLNLPELISSSEMRMIAAMLAGISAVIMFSKISAAVVVYAFALLSIWISVINHFPGTDAFLKRGECGSCTEGGSVFGLIYLVMIFCAAVLAFAITLAPLGAMVAYFSSRKRSLSQLRGDYNA
jgi:hypothetical protein